RVLDHPRPGAGQEYRGAAGRLRHSLQVLRRRAVARGIVRRLCSSVWQLPLAGAAGPEEGLQHRPQAPGFPDRLRLSQDALQPAAGTQEYAAAGAEIGPKPRINPRARAAGRRARLAWKTCSAMRRIRRRAAADGLRGESILERPAEGRGMRASTTWDE